tara:strand:+ start:53 stop:163 length:111 start_codon:yes stop_codon:yes gene_type:complete
MLEVFFVASLNKFKYIIARFARFARFFNNKGDKNEK